MEEITISSGSYNVKIYSSKIVEKLKNKLFLITPPTSLGNYESGPKETKIVNLLRITREININVGYICSDNGKTAKQVKDDLVMIFKGGLNANLATLTYDGDSHDGFIEDAQIEENSRDLGYNGASYPDDAVRYDVQLNFVVGNLVTG